MVLDTGDVMNSDVLLMFWKEMRKDTKSFFFCLVICNIYISDTIKTYKLFLPGNVTTKSKKGHRLINSCQCTIK